MCYDTAQLAYRIYRDAVRMNASPDEIERLKKRWQKLVEGDEATFYHTSGFQHPKLAALAKKASQIDIDRYTWGLIPHWVKDEQQASEIWNKTLNARGESIFDKPSFRDAAKNSRIVIPLDGFYEHHHKHGKTFPYYIRKKDGERMMVAGLSSEWINRDTGELMKTMTIVTTKGNELLATIHNNPKMKEARMPLILEDNSLEQWLEGNESEVKELVKPNTETELISHTVQRIRGKDYLGNCEETQQEVVYEELIEPPTLF